MTGATGGIGFSLANAIDKVCDRLVAIGRTRNAQVDMEFVYADFPDVAKALEHIRNDDGLGRVDQVLFLDCAAVLPLARVSDPGFESALAHAHAVNTYAPLAIAGALAAATAQGIASLEILHLSTGAVNRPIEGWGAYSASKSAALLGLRALAAENEHVRLTAVDPGAVDTPMQAALRAAGDTHAAAPDLLCSPEKIARQLISEWGLDL